MKINCTNFLLIKRGMSEGKGVLLEMGASSNSKQNILIYFKKFASTFSATIIWMKLGMDYMDRGWRIWMRYGWSGRYGRGKGWTICHIF